MHHINMAKMQSFPTHTCCLDSRQALANKEQELRLNLAEAVAEAARWRSECSLAEERHKAELSALHDAHAQRQAVLEKDRLALQAARAWLYICSCSMNLSCHCLQGGQILPG